MEMLISFRSDYIWLHKLTQNYLFFSDNLYKIIPFLRPRGRFAHLLSFVLEKNPIKSVWHTASQRAVVSSGMWLWLVYFSMFQYIFFIFSLFLFILIDVFIYNFEETVEELICLSLPIITAKRENGW